MTIIDNAVYVDGIRTADPENLDETYFVLRQREGMAWIGLYRPDAVELRSVAEEFDLNSLAVEDALAGHQRAKLEHYGECVSGGLMPELDAGVRRAATFTWAQCAAETIAVYEKALRA